MRCVPSGAGVSAEEMAAGRVLRKGTAAAVRGPVPADSSGFRKSSGDGPPCGGPALNYHTPRLLRVWASEAGVCTSGSGSLFQIPGGTSWLCDLGQIT